MADESPVPDPSNLAAGAAAALGASKLDRALGVASSVYRHRELLVAAMELLRDKKVLNQDDEVKLLAAYEQGTATARSVIQDMVEKLQKANLGEVLVRISEQVKLDDTSVQGVKAGVEAAKQQIRQEARPYLEKAKQRLVELKALEEPTIRRLEEISSNLADAGREVAKGLKGVGKEAADELVRRGRSWWMSAETEELEREFFDWALRNLPKAERGLVQMLVGGGILLFVTGIMVAAQEFGLLREFAKYGAIFVLLFLGIVFLNWGIKFAETMKSGRSEIERLARMSPAQRRLHLATRWTQRAQDEGLIDSAEAQSVIEETVRAMPEGEAASAQQTIDAAAQSAAPAEPNPVSPKVP